MFALDSDAHTTGQLRYAEIAIAHARLAAIPPERIVNCWSLEQLFAWLHDPSAVAKELPSRQLLDDRRQTYLLHGGTM